VGGEKLGAPGDPGGFVGAASVGKYGTKKRGQTGRPASMAAAPLPPPSPWIKKTKFRKTVRPALEAVGGGEKRKEKGRQAWGRARKKINGGEKGKGDKRIKKDWERGY